MSVKSLEKALLEGKKLRSLSRQPKHVYISQSIGSAL